MSLETFDEQLKASGATFADRGGVNVAEHFGDPAAEYMASVSRAGLYDARMRSLIQITGKDRASWLNNLVTNTIKDLEPGQGHYAFALNVKGRILFDMNMLILADAIWLDIDRRDASKAIAHFDRYLIMEDVQLKDGGNDYLRFALLGPQAAEIADAIGATDIERAAPLASTSATLVQKRRLLVRHDFAGVFGAELFVEVADAVACWQRLLEIGAPVQLRPVGQTAVEVLRIEAGIPAGVQDINEDVLPAETQQIDRAVCYTKGCYLGQEVVERMRSRGSIARQWVGFRLNKPIAVPATVQLDGADVGNITSACHSFLLNAPIAVGYIKSTHAKPGTKVMVGGNIEAAVVALPFRTTER